MYDASDALSSDRAQHDPPLQSDGRAGTHESPPRRETAPARERGVDAEQSDNELDALDVVLDASDDSFPASDPPSWIGMRSGRPRR